MAGDAGASQLNPPPESEPGGEPGPSRLGRRWLAGVAATFLLLACGLGVGGALALHYHQKSLAIARYEAAAVAAAKDCVGATQAPDTSSITASQQKILDCGTDTYRTQALLYGNGLIQAYQAANVHVQVVDLRAAAERYHDSNGSVDVLVAVRVSMSSDQVQNRESGYRLRATMTPVDGQYKISDLHQVTR